MVNRCQTPVESYSNQKMAFALRGEQAYERTSWMNEASTQLSLPVKTTRYRSRDTLERLDAGLYRVPYCAMMDMTIPRRWLGCVLRFVRSRLFPTYKRGGRSTSTSTMGRREGVLEAFFYRRGGHSPQPAHHHEHVKEQHLSTV